MRTYYDVLNIDVIHAFCGAVAIVCCCHCYVAAVHSPRLAIAIAIAIACCCYDDIIPVMMQEILDVR